MQNAALSKDIVPLNGTAVTGFCFVISDDLTNHAPQLVQLAKTAFPDLDITTQSDLLGAPGNTPAAPRIVPVATPAEELAQLLINGQPPATALENWTKAARQRLFEYRGARRHIKLLALGPLLEGSPDSWKALSAQIGLTAPAAFPQQPAAPRGSYDTLHRMVASYLLQTAPEAQALAAEIDAMIHGPLPASENPLRTAAEVLDAARAQRADSESLTTEAALLRENLGLLVTENGKLTTRQENLSRELAAMTELEARLSQTSNALVQAEKNTAHSQKSLRDLEHLHQRLTHDAKAISEALDQVLASTSWKLTGPLRKIVSRLRSQ